MLVATDYDLSEDSQRQASPKEAAILKNISGVVYGMLKCLLAGTLKLRH